MEVDLVHLKEQFSSIVSQATPTALSQFVIWLDMKVAEFKVNGFMFIDKSSAGLPSWLQKEIMHLGFDHTTDKGEAKQILAQSLLEHHRQRDTCSPCSLSPTRNSSQTERHPASLRHKRKKGRISDVSDSEKCSVNSSENLNLRRFRDTTSGKIITVDFSPNESDEDSDIDSAISNHVTANSQSSYSPFDHVTSRNKQDFMLPVHLTKKSMSGPGALNHCDKILSKNSNTDLSANVGIRANKSMSINNQTSFHAVGTASHGVDKKNPKKSVILVEQAKPLQLFKNYSNSERHFIEKQEEKFISSGPVKNMHTKSTLQSADVYSTSENIQEEQTTCTSLKTLDSDMDIEDACDVKPNIEKLQKSVARQLGCGAYGRSLNGSWNESQQRLPGSTTTDDFHVQETRSEFIVTNEFYENELNGSREQLLTMDIFDNLVVEALNTGNVTSVWQQVVAVCASHLLKCCDGKPTSMDYKMLSAAVYQKYPAIGTSKGPDPWSAFKKAVSQKIRHVRHKIRRGGHIQDQEMINSFLEVQRPRINMNFPDRTPFTI